LYLFIFQNIFQKSSKWFIDFRLDDAAFRRNNKGGSQSSSIHKPSPQMLTASETYENVSSIHSYENENDKLNHTELHCDKYKSMNLEKNIDQISTVFGERLHKKIKDENEEKKIALLKFNPEITAKETLKENIVESDKENGSQANINNDNESNIVMKSFNSGKEHFIFMWLYILHTIINIYIKLLLAFIQSNVRNFNIKKSLDVLILKWISYFLRKQSALFCQNHEKYFDFFKENITSEIQMIKFV